MRPSRFFVFSVRPDLTVRPILARVNGYATQGEAFRAWSAMPRGRSKLLGSLWQTDAAGVARNITHEMDVFFLLF